MKISYGDVLTRYLNRKLTESKNTLTNEDLIQIRNDYIEEEMLANLNGEQVPFASEYNEEIADFRREIDRTENDTTSEASSENKAENKVSEYAEETDAGGERYSVYSYPRLNNLERELLNRRLEIEIGNEDNFIDEYTKWLYASKNGTKVFAIYGIGWGDDATPLYAVGGKKAEKNTMKCYFLWRKEMTNIPEIKKILKAGLATTSLAKGKQAIIFLMMETEKQALKMAQFIANNKQATEKELMAEAQRIAAN